MGSWQDRNGSLAGQKWELGRTEIGACQDINLSLADDTDDVVCKTPHFASFSVIFVFFSVSFGWFLP